MIKLITECLIKTLINRKIIDNENSKELAIYRYGIELLIASIINLALILILGIITRTIIDSIIFILIFVPVRQCTGGYHAETYFVCNLVLALTYLGTIHCTHFICTNMWTMWLLMLLSLIVIVVFAPCTNKHKKTSVSKRKKFKLISCLIWIGVGLIIWLLPKSMISVTGEIVSTMTVIAILIVIDIINKRRRKKDDSITCNATC